jgi:hypothetical protein
LISSILSVKPLNFVHTRNKEIPGFTNKNIGDGMGWTPGRGAAKCMARGMVKSPSGEYGEQTGQTDTAKKASLRHGTTAR